MKKIYRYIAIALLSIAYSGNVYSQCANDNTLWIDLTPASCPGSASTSCIFGGEYSTVSVTTGNTYVFQTCGDTDFDTQITLYNNASGTLIGYNDDGCGSQSTITWTATFTGVVRVLVDRFNCISESTCMTLSVSCSPPGGNTYTHPTTGIQNTYLGACMVNTCNATYYDNGGSASNYSNNITDIYRTFCPSQPNTCITATVNSMDIEGVSGSGCYDYLLVLNGPTQNSPYFWVGCLTNAAPYTMGGTWSTTYTSTDASGCIGFRFYSDNTVTRPGWNITLSCTPCSGGPTPTNSFDCSNSASICGTTNLVGTSNGPGLSSTCGDCVTSENFSSWYKITIASNGTLAFTLNPNDNTEDYDFALYGPNVTCGSLGTPIRCSYAAITANGNTGMGNGASDNSEDVLGDGWVAPLTVTAGQTYYLMVNGWSAVSSGFNINWSGGTTSFGVPAGSVTVQTNSTCTGQNQGTACAVINAGTPPYTYNWNTGSGASCINNVGAGNYTVTVTDGSLCTSIASGTVAPIPNNTITLTSGNSTQTVCINTPIANITYSTTGATGATFSGLPAGVSGSWASNAITISGTPTASGTFNYTITLTGGCGTVTSTGTITVNPNNSITLTSGNNIQTRCINTAISPITYTTTGATGATFSGLPSGVTGSWASNTVTISGTPTASGTFNYTVTLTGGCGAAASATGTITVNPNNTITLTTGNNNQTRCINTAISTINYNTTGATGATFSGLPAGVTGSWAANVVTISGTPTASGTFNYTVTLTGGCGTVTATGTITVTPNNTITLTSGNNNQTRCINTAIANITYTSTGATGATFSGLPTGVSGSYSGGNITISGTPSVSGTYNYTVTLTGGCGTVTATGTLTITPNNTITLTSGNNTQTVCINTAIANITYTSTGATGATFSGLPTGVNGTYSGGNITISGSPSVSGSFGYTVTLTGGCGTITATGTITVTPNNTITLTSGNNIQTRCINTAIANITYTSTGATGATFSGLPAGVTGSYSGGNITISGTPTASGTFNYTVTLTGGCGTVTATGTLTVTPNNTITLTSAAGTNNQTRCINTAITNITYSTTGATGATFSGLPTGVTGSWAANVATISGTPSVSGTYNYTITLTGGCGTVTATGTITVTPNNTITLTSGNNTQTLCINTAIANITYSSTGATGATFSGLPAGVTGNYSGGNITISGSPSASGTFNYTVTLTGGCGTVTASGTITVTPNNTITLTSAAGTNNQTVCINTSITNITYSTTGATGATFSGLPAGVTGGWAGNVVTISGTPTAFGTFNYTITLTGGCGTTTATGTITVNPNNTITLTSAAGTNNQTRCINTAITNITYSTTGATGATFSGLPAGVTGSWAGNVVTISGTPTASGTFNYTVTLTGGCGTVTATGTITVTPNNTITLTSAAGTNNQTVCVNSAITNITYSTTGATGATFSGLPAGITGNYSGGNITISGSPTATGTFNYTVTLTGGCGTVTATGTLTVNAVPVIVSATKTDVTICGGSDGTITINATGAAPLTYSINGGSTFVANGGSFTNLPAANYPIAVSNTYGCITYGATLIVGAGGAPPAPVAGTNATICQGATASNLTATAGNGGTLSWYSNPGLTTLIGTGTTLNPNPFLAVGTNNFYATETVSGCQSLATTVTITVTPYNTITLTSGNNTQTVCINTAIAGISYTTTGATGATFSGLPAGVTGSWAANSISISGTPTAAGSFPYTITLTGGCGTITASGTITVTPNNTITLSSAAGTNNQTLCINTPITNITYSTTGATGATFSGLPAGVTGNWAANVATISGNPSASGTFSYTVTLTGGCGTVTATGTITVTPNNTITLTSGNNTQTVCINTAIANITYSTTGATGATFSGLPAGVTGGWAANVATISGTPTASGTFNYTVTLTGGCGTVTSSGTITVTPNNSITLSSAPGTNTQTVCINTAITNITYNTTGATGATFSGLPAGVTGSWAANVVTISGTPSASGTFSYTITLTGGCGTITATGVITVTPNNTITLTSAGGTNNQTVCVNTAITNITYSTTGATGATFSGLPAGVTGNWASNTVTITGTPTASGTFPYTITLTGGCGTVTATGTITVTSNNTITLTSGNNSQTVCINTAIASITYSTTGATGATFSGLPAGVTGAWAANVVTISGTPTASGTFNYTVTLTGGCGTVTATGTITVTPNNTITLTSANNTQTVCINTAIANITYTTTGATGATFSGLPAGVTGNWAANAITISGIPTASGSFPYTITLTGGCGTVTATGTLTVTPNNTITLTSAAGTNNQTRCINTAITNITYSTTGATGATISGLPAGVTGAWAANVVTISGTPTASGTFNYTITLTGGCGTITATGTITVTPNNTITLSTGNNVQTVCVNTPIVTTTYATTGAAGATFSGLPAGVTGSWAANTVTISGTPTASGTFNFTITLTGGCGTVTSTGTLTVTPNNTITLTSGNSTQSVCVNSPLVNITYNTTGATGATFSGLPAGVTGGWAANVVTISGTPTSTGTFNFTVTLIGGCGTVTATGTITVNSLPTPTASNTGAYCVNQTIELSSLPAGMTSYQWSGPLSYSAGTQNPSIPMATTLMAGTYTVTVTNSNSCTATASTVVVVNPLPTPYNVVGGGSYCAGGTGVVVGLDNSQFNTTYTLYLNGVTTGITTLGTGGPVSFGNQTAAGTYTVVASNNASYCTNNMTGSATIVVNPLPTVSAGGNQSIPNGTSVTLDGSASGGSGSYSYSWTPTAYLVNPTVEDPTTTILTTTTTYTLVVTDLTTGCQNSSQTVVSIVGGPLTATPTAVPNPICLGQSSQLNANATGGSNNYTYSWSSAPAGFTSTIENPSVSPTVTTTYTVTVSDGFTTTTSSVSVTVYPLPQQYEVSGGGSYCDGGAGLNVVLSGSQIGVDYQLVLNGGNIGTPQPGTTTGLVWPGQTSGGVYTVVATNTATGCSNLMAGSATININSLPFAYDVSGGGQYCSGGAGVIVGLNGSETGIQYQLLLNGSSTGAPVNGTGSAMDFGLQTTPGTYTVIGISTAMCNNNMNGNAVITVNPLPVVYNVTGGGDYCDGGSGLPVGLSGSDNGISYQLQYNSTNEGTPLAGTGTVLNFGDFLNAGTYSVIATDTTTTCVSNMNNPVTIVIDPLPLVYNVIGGGAYCSGGTGLSVSLATSEPGITYTLYLDGTSTGLTLPGDVTGISFDNLTAAGTYTIEGINNVTNCVSGMNGSVTIAVNPLPVIDSLYIHPLTSCVANNGEITVYATGTLPLEYSIDAVTYSTDSVFTDLPSGSFTVYVQDANGCVNSLTDVIPNNTGFSIDSIVTVNLLCNEDSSGQISVFATGGTLFSIDNGTTFMPDSVFTGLAAGSYDIIAMDDGGCNQSQTVTVQQPLALTDSLIISDVTCNGLDNGSAEITISGGTSPYYYLWDDSGASDSAIVTGLTAGIYYHVTVTDANGCILMDSVLTDQPDILVTAMNAADVLCNGESNGTADVTATGGTSPYTYTWDNPGLSVTASVNDLAAGVQYFVTVTDTHGCSAIDSVMVSEPPALTMTDSITQATCGSSDGSIELTVSGGTTPYSYLWTNAETTPIITGLGAGNYTVTVTDNNGCTLTGTYTIINMNAGAIQVTGITNVLCFGDTTGSIAVAVTGGTADFTYIWSTGDTLVTSSATAMLTGLIPGTYSVTVEDANGCISDTTVNVTGPAAGLLSTVTIQDITCYGMADGILIASATGGVPPYTYLWSNSMTGPVLSNMNAGNYSLTITDNNGCQIVEDSIVLTAPTLLRVFTDPDSPSCFGESTGSGIANVTGGTPPYSYAWSNQTTNQTITGIPAGQYFVTVTDDHGCTAISVMNVTQPTPIVVTNETGTDVTTNAGYIDLTVTGGGLPYTYFWSNNEITEDINNLTGGWYTYTITDANTCQISDSIYVELDLGIPNTITPNSDGKNDDFFIINIEAYEKVVIMIYSQWNELLYLFEGTGVEYNQEGTRFDGMFNGNKLPMGSYLYIITIGEEDIHTGALLIKY